MPVGKTIILPMTSPSTPPDANSAPITPNQISRGLDQLFAIASNQTLDTACERFYFLRHGQTPRNALRIFQAPDEPLSALGIEQAHAAAALLAHEPLAAIVSSNMARAWQTAGIVAARPELARLTVLPHAGLRERNFGVLNGSSSANIDWACSPEGGETLEAFVSRTRLGLAFALTHASPTLVVAHGGTIYVLMALLKLELHLHLLGNAQPLLFQRRDGQGGDWTVTPLGGGLGTTDFAGGVPASAAPNIS
jgi:glucosyl-3-phosphoglycerate phosphatase